MESVEELISRQAEMKTERAREEAQWRSIAEVFGPEAIDLDVHSKSTYDTSEIFDSTGLYARDAFVGGIFGQLTNPSNRWLGLGLDDADLEAWPPVADWLQRVSSRILGTADVGSSQFYSQVPAWLADLGMFGLGTGYSEKLPGGRYVDLAVPLGQTFIERDIYGSVTRLHREMMLTGRQLKRKFGPVERFEDKQSYVIVHAVRENDDFRPGRLGRNGMRWASTYFAIGEKDWRRDGGYEENPYFCVPWTERAGRTYPVGPGHLARPDGQMLQEMERAHLVAAQRAAEPSVGMPEDSILTAADFVPGRVLYGAVSPEGKPLAQPLSLAGDVRLSMAQSEQRRQAIRNAFYFGIMQLVDRPQMTATEFLGFQEEQLRLMAPNLAKIQSHGLSPWVARRYRILARENALPEMPKELDGARLRVEYQSPLAKMMEVAEGRATLQIVDGVMRIMQIDPAAGDNLDTDEAVRTLKAAFGGRTGLIRDPRAVAELRRQRAEQGAVDTEIDRAGRTVSIAAEAAHAAQAQTLSEKRMVQ